MNYEDVHRLFQILAASFIQDTDLKRRILYVQADEITETMPEGKVVKFTVEYADKAETLPEE